MDGVRLGRVRQPAGLRPIVSHTRRPATDFQRGRHPTPLAPRWDGALLPRIRRKTDGGDREARRVVRIRCATYIVPDRTQRERAATVVRRLRRWPALLAEHVAGGEFA